MSLVSVEMCGNPDCHVPGSCPGAPDVPLAGITESVDPAEADESILLRIFTQDLALSWCSDDQGVQRLVPAGSHFTVHRGGVDPDTGRSLFVALYDGPAHTKDEWLAGSPEFGEESWKARVAEFNAAKAA